jgi:hypothetical protein
LRRATAQRLPAEPVLGGRTDEVAVASSGEIEVGVRVLEHALIVNV